MSKITAIEMNLPMKEEWYAVGHPVSDPTLPKDKNIVTEIKDCTAEYEDGIEFIYEVWVAGQIYKSIVNSPVSVTYEIEGESIEVN